MTSYFIRFEEKFKGLPCACFGRVTGGKKLKIRGLAGKVLVNVDLQQLKKAWKKTFANL